MPPPIIECRQAWTDVSRLSAPDYVARVTAHLVQSIQEHHDGWAIWMVANTDEDHRHLVRMEPATVDSRIVNDVPFMRNDDLTLSVWADPPTFWCDLPADHPARR